VSEKVIKPGGRVVKGEAYDAAVEAGQIVEAAREQARSILEAVEQERQTIVETARREAYEEGLRQWNTAVAEADNARDRHLAESEPEMIRIAVAIAQKIIGEELRLNPQAIVTMAAECLHGLGRERSLILRVPPEDAYRLRERITLLREAAGPHRSIEVIADPSMGSGGCLVESEYGVIDARLETQIRCMEEILLRAARK
jgi:flagellar biosynthesis/type III secretory pathway protein FliH